MVLLLLRVVMKPTHITATIIAIDLFQNILLVKTLLHLYYSLTLQFAYYGCFEVLGIFLGLVLGHKLVQSIKLVQSKP